MANKVKAHLVFPVELLETIDKLVGKRKRSKFMTEAAKEKIAREKFLKALQEAAGSWKDDNHPELSYLMDINKYVEEIREGSEKRFREIHHE